MSRVWLRRQTLAALPLLAALLTPVSTFAEGRRFQETRLSAVTARLADGFPERRARRGPSPEAVLDVMNDYRERHRLPPLGFDRRLNAAAEDRIHDMFEQRYFDHTAPDGSSPFAAIRRRGYRYASAGENLAAGQRGEREVVEQWMRSPGHRANILGNFEDAGIAIAQGSPTGQTRGFTFVALYARGSR